jgi:hypothetical protein
MMPGSGFDVAEVQDGHYFTARASDQAVSWCLAVEPVDQGSCRLISRWRARWHVTPASAAWIALRAWLADCPDPGSSAAFAAAGAGHLRHAGMGNG